jgi:hypothetical protein
MRTAAGAFALILGCAVTFAWAGAAAPPCSTDTFTIDGNPLAVEVCAPAESLAGTKVTLTERFTLKGQAPLERPLVMEVLPKAGTSRSIDDVSLSKLGIEKTLHLTILFKLGSASLEHALLVPGAIALK